MNTQRQKVTFDDAKLLKITIAENIFDLLSCVIGLIHFREENVYEN